jgi:hypothetical protein
MRIIHNVALFSHSLSPEIPPFPLLAAPKIAGLLPARTPQPDQIDQAVDHFRAALIACQDGKLGLSGLLNSVTAMYYQITGEKPQVDLPRFRTIEDMNRELMEQHGDVIRKLSQHYNRDRQGGIL